jgi:hypothetical protein
MRRTGLGKGLGTLMEPAPSPGQGTGGSEGAVRLFLKSPEKPVVTPLVEPLAEIRNVVQASDRRDASMGWITGILFGLDALLVVVAGLLLRVGTTEIGKVLVLGSVMIGVAGVLGLLGVWLRGRQ